MLCSTVAGQPGCRRCLDDGKQRTTAVKKEFLVFPSAFKVFFYGGSTVQMVEGSSPKARIRYSHVVPLGSKNLQDGFLIFLLCLSFKF